MVNRWENICLDNIAFTSADNFAHHFPAHFHEEYTIGVAVNGVQRFELQDKSFVVEPGAMFLIKPQLIHAHYPVADMGWSFKSLYLSPDLMNRFMKGSGMDSKSDLPVLLHDNELYAEYLRFHATKQMPHEGLLSSFITRLIKTADNSTLPVDEMHPDKMETIKSYLSDKFAQKLHLDKIAGIFKMDKYQLIRQFKQHVGVTPNTYLTILRIEKARKMINAGYPIIEAALEAGFYDQSHFHHSFLHYTGITPGKFTGATQ